MRLYQSDIVPRHAEFAVAPVCQLSNGRTVGPTIRLQVAHTAARG
jgi:hypothetical protein